MKINLKTTAKPARVRARLAARQPALDRLNAALAKATTPSDLTTAEQIDLIRLRLFGEIAE